MSTSRQKQPLAEVRLVQTPVVRFAICHLASFGNNQRAFLGRGDKIEFAPETLDMVSVDALGTPPKFDPSSPRTD
jgi:hypothetical protein